MNKHLLFSILASLLLAGSPVLAESIQFLSPDEQASEYRQVAEVSIEDIVVPTVVELPLDDIFLERENFAVYDVQAERFEPYLFSEQTSVAVTPVNILSDNDLNLTRKLTDKKSNTFTDFLLPDTAQGEVSLRLTSAKPITSTSLTLLLANNVALPKTIEIKAKVNGSDRIVVAKTKMKGQTTSFLETTSDDWLVNLTYSQPLRISELKLAQKDVGANETQRLRWLAQPGKSYRVYFDADRPGTTSKRESANLRTSTDVLLLEEVIPQPNQGYTLADSDKDGVPNIEDNCVVRANPDQEDKNNNERGDVCDDFDQDGVMNTKDNCPNDPNRNQADEDGDGFGDVCDNEESRLTERHKWVPWVGIVFAVIVIVVLFAMTAKSMREEHGKTKNDGENGDKDGEINSDRKKL